MRTASTGWRLARRWSVLPIALLLVIAIALAWHLGAESWHAPSESSPPEVAAPAGQSGESSSDALPTELRFDRGLWSRSGLELAEVTRQDVQETSWVTGKVVLNEDRLAHIYSLVDGVVREVRVRLAQPVRAGEVLAIIDSKEVGNAKLELARARMNVGFVQQELQWRDTISRNTLALIEALDQQPPPLELHDRFRDQPMGDYREQLVTTYSRLAHTRADYERLSRLREQQITVEKDFIRAKADYESASASFQATVEQIRFTSQQERRLAEQELQRALASERISQSQLMILGYSAEEIAKMDPLAEGDHVAWHPIRAPFSGTVIAKDLVLAEAVGTTRQLFEIADLSTLWLTADIFEKDLALLPELADGVLEFRSGSYPDRTFSARVFTTGDVIDDQTRAIRMMAVADNPDHLLKPGMFVEVKLPRQWLRDVINVPVTALQEHAGRQFVFVHLRDDEFQCREVVAGRRVGDRREIVSGLDTGERIAVAGTFALKSEMLRSLLAED